MMRSFLFVCLCLAVAVVSGFQQQLPTARVTTDSSTAVFGLFDGFIRSMEAGYKGEDSAFAKQKAFDEEQRRKQKEKSDERRARGFRTLNDMIGEKKTPVEPKNEVEDNPKEDKKWGIF